MVRGHFLAKLANEKGWTRGAELGLWYGRTYCQILEACPQLTLIGVDLWSHPSDEMDHYRTWDHNANERKCREGAARFGDRAVLHKCSTVEAADLVADGTLDFVFIDADHRTEAVIADIRAWRPKLKPDGLLMGHDIDWPEVLAAVESECTGYEKGPDNVWWEA